MRQAPDHLVKLIEPIVEGMGYECVGIEFNPHPKHGLLRVYIDKVNGVVVDDCTKVSHQISGVLDVEDPIKSNYQLEVSSPGAERPLFTLSHFQRFIGEKAQVNLFKPVDNRKKITGLIKEIVNEDIKIEEAGVIFEIPFQSISKAHLVADYSFR